MLITLQRITDPSHSFPSPGIELHCSCTDYRYETSEWIIVIDATLSNGREQQIHADAQQIAEALSSKMQTIDQTLFERAFGGHYFVLAFHKGRRELFALRDVSGAKSGYVACTADLLVIGTNMHEVVRRCGTLRLDRSSSLHMMTFNYLFDGETFYRGVDEVPIGSVARWAQKSSWKILQRFALELGDEDNGLDAPSNVAALRSSILRAHEKRVGAENIVLLSGGIDSSVMLCALRETVDRSRIRAITFRIKGTQEDETGYATSLARHLGVPIELIEVDPANARLFENFEHDILQMNSPYFGRFIFGQFSGNPNQVYFAGQDTRLHTPDLNQVDKLAFATLFAQKLPVVRELMRGLARSANPLISMGFSTSKQKWKRGAFRAAMAFDLDRYLPRFFFKLNPESLVKEGYAVPMIEEALARVQVPWQSAKNHRHLYNLIVEAKWGEQYTDDMRYLQDVAHANSTHIALPFYDIDLARLSSALPFDQTTRFMNGHDKFSTKRMKVNKYLLREAFRNELTEELCLRAKAVSRSQHLMFSGELGKNVRHLLQRDLARGSESITASLGMGALAARFLGAISFRPEDEVFLTKVYWLSVLSLLGRDKVVG